LPSEPFAFEHSFKFGIASTGFGLIFLVPSIHGKLPK
jgi:hypothetical protein